MKIYEYFYRNFISPIHHLNSTKEANELEKNKDSMNELEGIGKNL